MTSVHLEYAHLLATTLMWKRFGDEKPKSHEDCLVRKEGDTEIYYYNGFSWEHETGNPKCLDSDLWLYLSDLDVLKVKEE